MSEPVRPVRRAGEFTTPTQLTSPLLIDQLKQMASQIASTDQRTLDILALVQRCLGKIEEQEMTIASLRIEVRDLKRVTR